MNNSIKTKIIDEFTSIYMNKIKKSWRLLLAIGIFFIVVGSISIFKSLITTIVSIYILGFVLLFSGIGYTIYSFRFWKDNWPKFYQYFILSIVYLAAGIILIQDPIRSSFPLTIFIAIFYMFVGLWRCLTAFQSKMPKSMLELLGGILAFIFGFLIWMKWPTSSLWVIGLFVGIDILLTGIYFVTLSLFARKLILAGD